MMTSCVNYDLLVNSPVLIEDCCRLCFTRMAGYVAGGGGPNPYTGEPLCEERGVHSLSDDGLFLKAFANDVLKYCSDEKPQFSLSWYALMSEILGPCPQEFLTERRSPPRSTPPIRRVSRPLASSAETKRICHDII